jgi:hypothetical protein
VSNSPTGKSDPYYAALGELNDAIQDGLDAIRAEQDAGRITTRQAADERVQLLERHLAEIARLRREHNAGGQ